MSEIKQESVLEYDLCLDPNIRDEIRELWAKYELGNDFYYLPFDAEEMKQECPNISALLSSEGIKECLIHFSW